jgi:hypothetical protein
MTIVLAAITAYVVMGILTTLQAWIRIKRAHQAFLYQEARLKQRLIVYQDPQDEKNLADCQRKYEQIALLLSHGRAAFWYVFTTHLIFWPNVLWDERND